MTLGTLMAASGEPEPAALAMLSARSPDEAAASSVLPIEIAKSVALE